MRNEVSVRALGSLLVALPRHVRTHNDIGELAQGVLLVGKVRFDIMEHRVIMSEFLPPLPAGVDELRGHRSNGIPKTPSVIFLVRGGHDHGMAWYHYTVGRSSCLQITSRASLTIAGTVSAAPGYQRRRGRRAAGYKT